MPVTVGWRQDTVTWQKSDIGVKQLQRHLKPKQLQHKVLLKRWAINWSNKDIDIISVIYATSDCVLDWDQTNKYNTK